MTSVPVDLELKKAFADLQLKLVDASQKAKLADVQIEGLKRSILHKQITDREINNLTNDSKVYQGVGRCFFTTTVPEVRQEIGKTISDFQEKIKVLEANKERLDQDIKTSENALRDLVRSKQSASS